MPAYPKALPDTPRAALTSRPVPPLRTRKPTGLAPWPHILIDGAQGTGKSHMLVQLALSDRIGSMWCLDWDEDGTLDELAALPGVNFEMIDHNGRWADILGQLRAVSAEATKQVKAGSKVPVLGVDSGSASWDCLKNWVDDRAARSPANQKLLSDDPGADIRVPNSLWNSANKRHDELMDVLRSFPGIVVMTARSKTTIGMDEDGRPAKDERNRPVKVHKIEVQKRVPFLVSTIISLSADHPPTVIKARSVHSGIRPGVDKPKEVPDLTLEWLIFDYLKCGANTVARTVAENSTRTAFASEGELKAAKEQVWARAQEVGWDYAALARHFHQVVGLPLSDADAAELIEYIPQIQGSPDDAVDQAETKAIEADRLITELEATTTRAQIEALTPRVKELWNVRLADRKATVGELAKAHAEKIRTQATTHATGRPLPEIEQLLIDMKIPESDWLTMATGMIGRQVKDLRHDLRGDYRANVLNELRNLAAMGTDREPVLGTFILDGQKILARVASAVA